MKYSKIMVLYILIIIISHVVPTGVNLSGLRILFIRLDYLVHVLAFLPWMTLMWLYLQNIELSSYKSRKKYIVLWLLTGIILAVSVEALQLFIPQRLFNPVDLLLNVAGVVLGAIIFVWKPKSKR